jgi:diguanylate cyclase (GGDEF)-like protein
MLLNKIVVAEDEDAIAHLVAAALGDAGYLCLRARDGEEALRLARREMPDCLVLDLMMPRIDGLEVTRRLKADVLASRIPVLLLTAMADVEDRIRGLDAGADDYLVKPFDLRELTARVRALVRASKRERDRNPTTNLPGAGAVEDHVDALLKAGAPCALLYLDIDHFEAYADAFGFHKADDVAAELGRLVLERSRVYGGGAAFVGHVGGDDFVVVADPEHAENLARELVDAFDARVSGWYEEVDGSAQQMATRMTLSIALVDAHKAKIKSLEELSRLLAATKRQSKKQGGSNFVIFTPEG